ncbi:hypothetical protein D3C72_1227200 [compost metagenome]
MQPFEHALGEIVAQELDRRRIDGNGRHCHAMRQPLGHVGKDPRLHGVADPGGQFVILECLRDRVRQLHIALRRLPAQQGFEPDDFACVDIDFGLVVGRDELIANDFPGLVNLRRRTHCGLMHLLAEQAHTTATDRFHVVQGSVGAFEQPRCIACIARIQGAANAHAAIDGLAGVGDGGVDLLANDFCQIQQVVFVRNMTDCNCEFVATQASKHRVGGKQRSQPAGEYAQQVVPCDMAERVVDVLEMVQIQQHDAKLQVMFAGMLDDLLNLGLEHAAIGQAGQVVLLIGFTHVQSGFPLHGHIA